MRRFGRCQKLSQISPGPEFSLFIRGTKEKQTLFWSQCNHVKPCRFLSRFRAELPPVGGGRTRRGSGGQGPFWWGVFLHRAVGRGKLGKLPQEKMGPQGRVRVVVRELGYWAGTQGCSNPEDSVRKETFRPNHSIQLCRAPNPWAGGGHGLFRSSFCLGCQGCHFLQLSQGGFPGLVSGLHPDLRTLVEQEGQAVR